MKTDKARLIVQLRRDEGVVPYVYNDPVTGLATIGCGRLVDRRRGGRLREDEIDYLLSNDIDEKYQEVIKALPWAEHIGEARLGALVAMAFQLGTQGLLGFVQTLAAIRDGHYAHAAVLALQSKWAKQTPQRARRIARQIETDAWQ